MNAKQIWQSVLDRIKPKVSQATFQTWFKGTSAVSLEGQVLTICVRSTFSQSHLNGQFKGQICAILDDLIGSDAEVSFVIGQGDEPLAEARSTQPTSRENDDSQELLPLPLEAVGMFTSTALVRRQSAVAGASPRWDQGEASLEQRRRLRRAEAYSGPELLSVIEADESDPHLFEVEAEVPGARFLPRNGLVVESDPLAPALPAASFEESHEEERWFSPPPFEEGTAIPPITPFPTLAPLRVQEEQEEPWSEAQPVAPAPWETVGRVEAPSAGNAVGSAAVRAALAEGMLNAHYTFETFVAGKSNQVAYDAARHVAEHPVPSSYPLFIYGGVGLGKTHLLQAAARVALENGYKVLYVTSDHFTNDVVNAIRFRTTEALRAKYRQLDMLLIDDVQFLAGKTSTEEELFHTYNALHSFGKQMVLASDRAPQAIHGMQDRLRSRFGSGLMAGIREPEHALRLAITRAKGEQLNLHLSHSVVEHLARPQWESVRELEGNLNRIILLNKSQRRGISLPMVLQALGTTPADNAPRKVDIETVLALVCEEFQVTLDDLKGSRRSRDVAWPRQIAMYLLREIAQIQLERIGLELGGRDHTTVLYGVEKVSEALRHDLKLGEKLHHLELELRQKEP